MELKPGTKVYVNRGWIQKGLRKGYIHAVRGTEIQINIQDERGRIEEVNIKCDDDQWDYTIDGIIKKTRAKMKAQVEMLKTKLKQIEEREKRIANKNLYLKGETKAENVSPDTNLAG